MSMVHTISDLSRWPELRSDFARLSDSAWPAFLRNWETPEWPSLFTTFADYQLALRDAAGKVVAVCHTIPMRWNGTKAGLPASLSRATGSAAMVFQPGLPPNTLCALAAIAEPDHRGQGLGAALVRAMGMLAAERGFENLIAPVRPNWKSQYPLIPLEKYVEWKRPDGTSYDPWLRVHLRAGGKALAIGHALAVEGRVADWEQWTGMVFPVPGHYVVPGALQPLVIDSARDKGLYEEKCVWVVHNVGNNGRDQ